MSAAGWFVVVLALALANLPFFNQRLFGCLPVPLGARGRKSTWWRILELVLLYAVVGGVGFWFEARVGNRFDQGWQFYAVTFSLFVVFAFPGFTFQYLVKRR